MIIKFIGNHTCSDHPALVIRVDDILNTITIAQGDIQITLPFEQMQLLVDRLAEGPGLYLQVGR